MTELDVLWQPIAIGGVRVPNRIVFSGHTSGFRGSEYADYLAERARGGSGLIVTGAIPVHPTSDNDGATWTAYDRGSVAEIRTVVDAVRAHGCPLFVQLGHSGVHSFGAPSTDYRGLVFAPSALPSPHFGVIAKAMSRVDIEEVTAGFVAGALHAQEAGADGVEIHAAHGLLLSQFLSPLFNVRTDEYGGDVARRARLVREIGTTVRERCGAGFAIGLKLNFDEFVGEPGITPAEAERTIRLLHASGVFDYFSISGGSFHSFQYMVAPESSGLSGHFVGHARQARAAVGGEVPIIVTGRIRTVPQAAEIVQAGAADLVGMIRAQIADPDIVRKSHAGGLAAVRHCVGANQGCWRRVNAVGSISCTVNPLTGREADWGARLAAPAARTRRLLVVGGGPAGMKFAETAAMRGHEVVLLERDTELGGQIRYAGRLPHRAAWSRLVDDLAASLERLGVEVRLGVAAIATDVRAYGAEVIAIATGSVWDESGFTVRRVGVAGIRRTTDSHVIGPIAALAAPATCGERVVIVDDNGDHLPLGLAEHFATSGHSVTVVTAHPSIGHRLGTQATVDFAWVYPRALAAGARIAAFSFIDRIERDRVVLTNVWTGAEEALGADTVILCMMRHSEDALYHELEQDGAAVLRIGDCVAPREVDDALFEAVREGSLV
jgi:2,4-dienoyl-CoA reductase-like NADH-dependent reductase (Old Yellow Enzyme family)